MQKQKTKRAQTEPTMTQKLKHLRLIYDLMKIAKNGRFVEGKWREAEQLKVWVWIFVQRFSSNLKNRWIINLNLSKHCQLNKRRLKKLSVYCLKWSVTVESKVWKKTMSICWFKTSKAVKSSWMKKKIPFKNHLFGQPNSISYRKFSFIIEIINWTDLILHQLLKTLFFCFFLR